MKVILDEEQLEWL